MARLPPQNTVSGRPAKPPGLTEPQSVHWDRLIEELEESGVKLSPAHRGLVEMAVRIGTDIEDTKAIVEGDGAYRTHPKTEAVELHPAARRLDRLRREYVKVLASLGVRSEGPGSGRYERRRASDFLND